MVARIDALAALAPDVVNAWRAVDDGRAALRARLAPAAEAGSAARVATQLAAVADGLSALVTGLPGEAFAMPGGEADWNVAQAIGHAADARARVALAGSLAASGRWPAETPPVATGVPGPADAGREQLLRRIAASQRIVERAARSIAGHEADPCPLDHPLVGRLRCGEWLLFAGVHDLMHVEQLERLEASP